MLSMISWSSQLAHHYTMSLKVYNQTMTSLLKQQQALIKLREELERRKERKYWGYWQFGHLVKNCKNKKGRDKKKKERENRFEVLTSRVIQCGIREVRRMKQKKEEERGRCFRYREERHKKWECPKRKKRRGKEGTTSS